VEPVRRKNPSLPAIVGDPGHDAVLESAGIGRAAGVVFAMENEKDNVIGVLTARRLAPRARIVSTSHTPETEAKLGAVGADAVVTPERIGGLRLASVLVRPAVVTFLDRMLRQQGGALRVEEVRVPEGAVGRTLESLRLDDVPGALLVALSHAGHEDFSFKPAPSTALMAGDVLVLMVDADGLARVRGRLE
jgi:voltage-gated potassium channel